MRRRVKDAMSSFDIGVMVREISPLLVDRLVDNIYQLNSHILLLSFQGLQKRLLLEAGRRLHLTAYRHDVPGTPPAFCRALRKHLRRTRLNRMVQVDFDRIVRLEFSSAEGEFSLYTELFGKGNHILVDGEERILHALTYRRMRTRDVVRREILRLPPSARKNILEAERCDVEGLFDTSDPLARQLTRIFNIGGLYAEETASRAGLDGSMTCASLSQTQIDMIYDAIQSIIASYRRGQPHIVLDEDGTYLDVLSFPLKMYEDLETVCFPSFSRAADEYYMKLQTRKAVSEAASRLNERLEEQRRILAKQKTQMKNLEKSIATNQKIGDTIYANSYRLQEIIDRLMRAWRSGKPWSWILEELDDGLEESILVSVDPDGATATIEIEGARFKLDLRKSVYENASVFYERAKASTAKLEGLQKAIWETQSRIERILSAEPETVEAEVKPVKVRRRAWYEKFHWFHSSDGLLVLGGRDATTNEILIKRHTDSTDIVLHADMPGSPFAVIKTRGSSPSEAAIREAAQMVASYSKAWRSGVSAVDVYWVRPEQVSKTPPSGEYLPRGSFMIYGPRNYLRNVPLRLAIGVKETPDRLMAIGGPPSAIAAQTDIFVEIVPGRIKTGKLVRTLVSKLIKKASEKLKSQIRRLPLQEFQVFIPGGRGEIATD